MVFLANIFLKPVKLKYIDIQNAPSYLLDQDSIEKITNTTNNIFLININGEEMYFRPCRRHLKIKEYVFSIIKEFLYDQKNLELYNEIVKNLNIKKNFKKFINMGLENDKSSPIFMYQKNNNSELLGIPQELNKKYSREIYNLLQYIWGEIFLYKLNNRCKKNEYQTYNSSRLIATYNLAKNLGVEYLIPEVKYCYLEFHNSSIKYFGTIMKKANGFSPEKIQQKDIRKMITPKLQKELMILNVFDVLCYQKDHRPGNYNIEEKDEKLINVYAFDNDAPMTFSFIKKINFKSYIGCDSLISSNGSINRPHIDAKLCKKILSIKKNELVFNMDCCLNKVQIIALKSRFLKLKKAICKTIKINNNFVIDEKGWSEKSIQEELSGKYGNTYLCALLNNDWR